MTEKEQELLPCPFCGGKAESRYHFGSEYVICKRCFAQTDKEGCQYPEKDWNRRAESVPAPQWTTEPPKENGNYYLAIKDGDAEWDSMIVEVEHLLGEWYVRSFLFQEQIYQDMFNCLCGYETYVKNIMEAEIWEIRWCKIVPPPMPERREET